MTVPVPGTTTYAYNADGVTTVFSYPVRFLEAGELLVIREDANGVQTVQVYNTDYTVSGAGNPSGGSITFLSVPVGGKVIITRQTAAKQLVDLEDSQRNPAEAVELQLDRLAMVDQDQGRDIGRSLKLAVGAPALPEGHFPEAAADGSMRDGGSSVDIKNAQANAAQTTADRIAAAASAAAAAASAASVNLPALTANTMLVDNAAGTAREAKTFAEVRTKLQSIAFSELGTVEAWNNGVPGDGTDQTVRLQSLIDALPAEGGTILLKGDVYFTALDGKQRRHVQLKGLGGIGAGSAQRTYLRCTSGAVGGRAIDLRDTVNFSLRELYVANINTAYDGTLIDYGVITTGASYMSIRDCLILNRGTTGSAGLNLYGATQGVFNDVAFTGQGRAIQMQNTVGLGWCNVHNFTACHFKPAGSIAPVQGSGEGITFMSCNIQASSADGKGRFWDTSTGQKFKGVSLVGNTFYDPTATGAVWANFYTGSGLNLIGNRVSGENDVSGGGNWGFQIGGGADGVAGAPLGVAGFAIIGNSFEYMTAGVNFGGTPATFDNARAGFAAGNHAIGTLSTGKTVLFSNVSSTEKFVVFPNEINAGPNDFGAHWNLRYAGVPTSSSGLQTGDVWSNSGVLTMA